MAALVQAVDPSWLKRKLHSWKKKRRRRRSGGPQKSNLAPRYCRRVLCVISALFFLCLQMGQTEIISELKNTANLNSCRSNLTRSAGYESVLRREGWRDVTEKCDIIVRVLKVFGEQQVSVCVSGSGRWLIRSHFRLLVFPNNHHWNTNSSHFLVITA